jgi:MFS transporter, ACS family, DAL5 transporter family protein
MKTIKAESLDNAEKSASGLENNVSNQTDEEFYVDPVKEVKLLAKLDLAFTPVIMLVYLSCFLDRSNIGLCYPSSNFPLF